MRRTKAWALALVLALLLPAGGCGQTETEPEEQDASAIAVEIERVERGSISSKSTVSGQVAAGEQESVFLGLSAQCKDVYVEQGDTVTEGDILAYLDLTSVMSAMNDLQTELEELDSDIADAAKETVDNVMKSTVVGRVKGIYCEVGDSVLSIMYEHGALMTISLDGHMAVDIPAAGLSAGDTVTVTLSDGTAYPGTVDEVREDEAVVLITDNKPLLGDKATVTDEEGKTLGTGELYIHQPLNITGYAGTVSRLMVTENAPVTKNRILLYLTDTTFTANYDALLQQRAQVEDDLNELISLYRTGVVRAPLAGKVESITDEQETVEGAEVPAEWTFAVIRPQEKMIATASIDESNILSVEVGQTASVTISSISDDPFTGEVTSIEKTGTSTSGVTGYSVEVTLDRTEKMLTRMSATVSIRIEGVDDALLLPEDAVTKTRTSAYVYTSVNLTSGELEGMVEVKTGLTGGGYVEITEGLKEGDTVYYTKKQSNDFSSFMGGFGGGFGGGSGSGGFSMPGGGSGGGSGSGSGSGSSRPRGSRSGNSGGGQP